MSDTYTPVQNPPALLSNQRTERRSGTRDPYESELQRLRRQFENYASVKDFEIRQARTAWNYYYAEQFTSDQLREYKKRNQPAITFDRIGRKIDGLVGIIRKLRTDPKAYPRTLNQEQGADVATQVVRTIMDGSRFEDLEAECARDAAVGGIGVTELQIIKGDKNDPNLMFGYTDPRTFFYDPRSVLHDFADARFMGTYKWAEADEIEEIAPGSADALAGAGESEVWTSYDADRDILWVDNKDRYRLVDHWYIEDGVWKWCLHVGSATLLKGTTPFFTDTQKPLCKFFPFATFIDQNGDHIGYIRRLKGPQDAMNQHRSKALHIMNTRQIKVRKGAVEEKGGMEALRREAAKPDGVLEWVTSKDDIEVLKSDTEFLQQTQYYQDAKQEIESFGPNPALLGDLSNQASGRAYAFAQQAGLAEMGPFMKNFRIWKLHQYEAAWWGAQRFWTSERFIRVTDDQQLAQFLQINALKINPQTMQPILVNALGSINVDILLDEGPDTETVQGDVYDVLMTLAQSKVPVPPAAIIQMSNLPGDVKKQIIQMLQPDPQQQQVQQVAQRLQLEGTDAKNKEMQSKTALNVARAHKDLRPEMPTPQEPDFVPPQVKVAQSVADIHETQANTLEKLARAHKQGTEADRLRRTPIDPNPQDVVQGS